ncbi:hypothetical protein GCM10010512_46180 [Streptomyces thermoviolaceus subsp. thermoviolaceus]|nr:hypothetical protein GCM10010499_27140 [Streptomyces thermoviolaceus subsp. apingens]GHB09450.1 hypothetical protein GCM10010512_46180 [Streptomyces thermoviolaceus subsp. thermoviolaceus]
MLDPQRHRIQTVGADGFGEHGDLRRVPADGPGRPHPGTVGPGRGEGDPYGAGAVLVCVTGFVCAVPRAAEEPAVCSRDTATFRPHGGTRKPPTRIRADQGLPDSG